MSISKLFILFVMVLLPVRELLGANPVSFKAHLEPVRKIIYSSDGKKLLTASHGKHSLKLWNVVNNKLIREYHHKGPTGIILADFTPNEKKIYVSSWDKRIRIWDLKSGKLEKTITTAGMPHGASFSKTKPIMAVAFLGNNIIQIVDLPTGKINRTLTVPMEKPPAGGNSHSQVQFTQDGRWLVATCGGKSWPKFIGGESVVTIWDTATWTLRAKFKGDKHHINSLELSEDGEWIAGACYHSWSVKVWKRPTISTKPIKKKTIQQWIKELNHNDFHIRRKAHDHLKKAGRQASQEIEQAAKSQNFELKERARQLLASLEVNTARMIKTGNSDVHSMAFSRSGKLLAWGCLSNKFYLSEIMDSPSAFVTISTKGIWSIGFSPDEKSLAVGTKDGKVTIYKVAELLKNKVKPQNQKDFNIHHNNLEF